LCIGGEELWLLIAALGFVYIIKLIAAISNCYYWIAGVLKKLIK